MDNGFHMLSRIEQFSEIITSCEFTDKSNDGVLDINEGVRLLEKRLTDLKSNNRRLYIFGNGGSAAVASHAAVDFLNVGGVKASTLHESSMLTCMANDFGYEKAYAKMLAQLLNPGDMVIVISSSGQSLNIINAAAETILRDGVLVTLSGFIQDNPLRKMGELNFWLNSNDYGMVEIGHQFILHNVADRLSAEQKGQSCD